MKKTFFALLFVLTLASCNNMFTDELAALQNQIDDIKVKMSNLNNDIEAMKAIVNEISNGGYVTSIDSYSENNVVVGYKLVFGDGRSIIIRNGKDGVNGKDGKDGKDGQNGKDGVDGKDGQDGQNGKDGENGKDGQDGKDGVDGKDGQDGKDGVDGKDGQDGSTPVLGVRQDSDGEWYWTVNGNWLFDTNGNKVKATGKNGKDGKDGTNGQNGITPQLKIGNDGYWYVSYDNGSSWISLGIRATGQNGNDGHTPQIGVRIGTDGFWYWTVDGEWLLNTNGEKVRATGEDGQDGLNGITPKLKIENDYWFVSYDGGITWQNLNVKATGKDGENGADGKDGDSFFSNVTVTDTFVILTLSDGSVISIPRGQQLDISFDVQDLLLVDPNQDYSIPYTISSSSESISIEVLSSPDIKAKVIPSSSKSGTIQIRTGLDVDEYSKLVVLVSDNRSTIMRSISFLANQRIIIEDNVVRSVSADGEDINLRFTTNTSFDIIIPNEAKSWLSIVPSTKSYETYNATIRVAENKGQERTAEIEIRSTEKNIYAIYTIHQYSKAIVVTSSANCYIVKPGGSVSFPLVKGNSSESVGSATQTRVIWESFNTTSSINPGDIIDHAEIDGNNMIVSVKNAEGNAIVAAVDASNTVLWSWHIWVTGFDPEETKEKYSGKSIYMMDRNLGALSDQPEDVRSFGLYYQWGRKDPFPSLSEYQERAPRAKTTNGIKMTIKSSSTGTVSYAIKHPDEFIYMNSFLISDDWLYTSDNGLWTSDKTIHDPCPAGWMVPEYQVWSSLNNTSSIDAEHGGVIFGYGMSSPYAWYPWAGYMYAGTTSNWAGGSIRAHMGGYWSCTPESLSSKRSYYLVITTSGSVTYNYLGPSNIAVVPDNTINGSRASGRSVRCRKI